MGVKDGHHVVQHAAVRDLPGYDYDSVVCVGLPGPSTTPGTPHYNATQAQRDCAPSGTLGDELNVADCSLQAAGLSPDLAGTITDMAERDFAARGHGRSAKTRKPGNRK
jgi:hypothetical protein